jgi:isopentenyl diphosphate isomerase/L-lactate dehydrogenase-like FMN-dependent dehydrogenase
MHGGIASIPEMIARAQRALSEGVRDHIAGAAGTEATLKRNRLGLGCLAFGPRVLRDVSDIDTGTSCLGITYAFPSASAGFTPGHSAPAAKRRWSTRWRFSKAKSATPWGCSASAVSTS